MLEFLAIPAAIAVAAMLPSRSNDKSKIQKIFENVGYGIRDKEGKLKTPRYKSKTAILDGEEAVGVTYKYSIPLGLPATKMAKLEKDIKVFTDGLQKPVEVEFNRTLNIHVYDKDLPSLVPYSDIPKRSDEWVVPLGKAVSGMVWHNFDHVPHMTLAGTTRFGKTVMLKVIMTYLIENHGDDVEFYVIDLKGGLEFGRYDNIRQVKRVASDPFEAIELLQDLQKIYEDDYQFYRQNHYANVVDTDIKKRRFIIVDEGAQLAAEKWMDAKLKKMLEHCQWLLGEVARLTGALGYRLIFATQYPTADTLPRQIKQNADIKVSFRLPSGYASGVAIDDYGAEELPSNIKGRALIKTHELKEVQVPFISHDEMMGRLFKYQEAQILEGVPENVVEYREETDEGRKGTVVFK